MIFKRSTYLPAILPHAPYLQPKAYSSGTEEGNGA